MVNLTLVPFGNAHIGTFGKLSCQHGEEECEGNSWEQCAIHLYPDPSDHYPFYYCMEKAGDSMLKEVQKCAESSKMDYSKLSECKNDKKLAMSLQKAASAATPSDHKYVPWITLNGKKSPSDGDKILAEVCKAYTGTKPAACSKYLEESDKRCYLDNTA